MMKFFVAGTPVPKGSAKGFVVKSKQTGKFRAIVTQDNGDKQKPWASSIHFSAQQQMNGVAPFTGPVCISLSFIMPRLKGHYGTGKNANLLKPGAPLLHTVKPDLDKLVRCVKDALTGVVWVDDAQVCELGHVCKHYGEKPGVMITIEQL